jgi:hypothetical protein
MMKKLRILLLPVLVVCLLMAAVAIVPAYADDEEDASLAVDEISPEELAELDTLELVPATDSDKAVNINGGFEGIWVTATDARTGKVAGLYGRVTCDDGQSYGYFGGLWRDSSGRMAGYLKGRYQDGRFRGVWRCLETGNWGPVVGRYYPVPSAESAEVCYTFVGRWATVDGQLTGSLQGSWAPLAKVKPEGRFNGQWQVNDDVAVTAAIDPDGKLAGSYGVAVFKNGTSIRYFRGRWTSKDGVTGALGGLVFDGRFCGLWSGTNSVPRGYLKGVWENYRFKGVWGQFGQSVEGRLWGQYRPILAAQSAEPVTAAVRTTDGVVKY